MLSDNGVSTLPTDYKPMDSPAAEYKFVELSAVTDQAIERVVNEWVAKGWQLDGIHFAMRESSKRPAMAFVQFIREEDR